MAEALESLHALRIGSEPEADGSAHSKQESDRDDPGGGVGEDPGALADREAPPAADERHHADGEKDPRSKTDEYPQDGPSVSYI